MSYIVTVSFSSVAGGSGHYDSTGDRISKIIVVHDEAFLEIIITLCNISGLSDSFGVW